MTLKLGTKEYELAPITKNEWEYFHKTINEFAAKTYNPYPDFYQKIAFLPKEDRQAAVQGMNNRTNWEIPNEYIQQILSHVDTVKHIFLLITHAPFEDHELITEIHQPLLQSLLSESN